MAMARIKIDLPESFAFSTTIPIRITDVNYGGHVGNDTFLSIIHEARVQFLQSFGFNEKDIGGSALIMGDVAITFKSELFYGDTLTAYVAAANFTRVSFDLVYLLKKGNVVAAEAKTGMVCFNYQTRKIAALPENAKSRLVPSDT